MKVSQDFIVARPLPVVWAFFKDVPRVARCLPGAEYLGSPKEGSHAGKVSSKLGPFSASFEGEAVLAYDEDAKTVRADGKGVDRKGNSRSRMGLDCRLLPEGNSTRVVVDADIQLSGAIAQFGRTGLIDEVATVLIGDFVKNAEAELGSEAGSSGVAGATQAGSAAGTASPSDGRPASAAPTASLGVMRLLLISITAWVRSLFRRSA